VGFGAELITTPSARGVPAGTRVARWDGVPARVRRSVIMQRTAGRPIAALALAALLATAGCTTRLVPAPGSQVLPGSQQGAVTRREGVQLSASARAWTGQPRSLPTVVTPILVTIDNHGTVPLLVRRNGFALVPAGGAPIVARGPQEVTGVVAEPPPPGVSYPRFSFGVGLGRGGGWGLGLGVPFGDPFFYDDYYYPMQVRMPLPTPDMVQQALPESVLAPGASTSGFLYFDRVKRKPKQYDFTANLVDARSGQPVGTITIPFVVD